MKKTISICVVICLIAVIGLFTYINSDNRTQDTNAINNEHQNVFNDEANTKQIPTDASRLFIRAKDKIQYIGQKDRQYNETSDAQYQYQIGQHATATVTIRTFKNEDQFIFMTLQSEQNEPLQVNIYEELNNVTNDELYRYDRYPIERVGLEVFGDDQSTYPTGLLRLQNDSNLLKETMVGKAFRSKQLTQTYENTGGTSYVRDLQEEYEALTTKQQNGKFYTILSLKSNGQDTVDTWMMQSKKHLFNNDDNMNAWMQETAKNTIKRNKWYTAQGQYSKMATTVEPMPESQQGFGRNLLMQKEDRALVLYKKQGDRYFENLVNNGFVSLEQFKGDSTYWETEVTSTSLKRSYNITAPFVDTRFNEQIALYFFNSGEAFGIKDYKEPLRNYADLLLSAKERGSYLAVNDKSYYITDYFVLNEQVKTHASLNHVLGGMNILLLAYEQFGDEKYLQGANAIYEAIRADKDQWIRDTGDTWYQIGVEREFAGNDYKHLTLEDLINSYRYYKRIDPSKLPLIEQYIASKSNYLSNNEFGYTVKIKNGLEELGLMQYLPEGEMYTDAQ